MLLQQKQEMYLSLNFRWPVLMGDDPSSQDPAVPVSNSAFRTVGPSCNLGTSTSSRTGPLPPISCLKEPALSTQPRDLIRPGLHHPEPLMPGTLAVSKGLGSGSRGAGPSGASVGAGPSPHPAFPVPSLLGPQQHPPCHLSHLQNLLSVDKSLGLPPYIHDPLTKAALLDFHGRLQGQIPLSQYPLGKKLFGCPQCRYITDRKNNLKRHIATMHQECDKVLECCGVVFKNKASLRDHVLIFHSNGYMCRYCGRNFCRKALLKRHLTVHSGQKDFLCGQCDYATSHKSNLERHKRVHERQALGEDCPDDEVDEEDEEDEEVEVGEIRHPYRLPAQHPASAAATAGHFMASLHPATRIDHYTNRTSATFPSSSSREPTRSETTAISGGQSRECPSRAPLAGQSASSTCEPPTSKYPDLHLGTSAEDDDDDDDPGSVVIDVVSLVNESC